MAAEGIECALIVPTHLLPGAEYDKIRETAARWEGRFPALRLSRPPAGDAGGPAGAGRGADGPDPPAEGPRPCSWATGPTDPPTWSTRPSRASSIWPGGTTWWWPRWRAGPGWEEVLPLVTAPAVELVPLMLVAGDHALHDMAGEGPDSWKRLLQSRGHTVSCRLTGLGALPPGTGPLCPPPGGASGRVLREETCRGKGAADAGALHHCGREAPALRTHHRDLRRHGGGGGRCGCSLTGRAPDLISLNTPRDWMVGGPLLDCVADGETAACSVEKDGGDDVDATHGLPIRATVRRRAEGGRPSWGGSGWAGSPGRGWTSRWGRRPSTRCPGG